MSFASRVAKGAEMLDATVPGWALLIGDVATLDMSDSTKCIRGRLGARAPYIPWNKRYMYGLDSINPDRYDEDYRALKACWIDEIVRRVGFGDQT